MFKKIFIFVFIGLIGVYLVGCEKPGDTVPTDTNNEIELINDRLFQNGFSISPADRDPQPENRYPLEYDLTYGDPTGNIAWLLGQAGNRFGLADAYAIDGKEIEFDGSNYIIEDPSKRVVINPNTGRLTFEVNASEEFESPRVDKEGWPHLIIQQGLSQQFVLTEAQQMVLSLSITLDKMINQMTEDTFNPSLHTAQYLMYIVVRSNAAQDAGEYMWFGIPFFDARYTVMPESGMMDAGTAGNTGKFIYQMPQVDFMPNGLILEEKIDISIDLVPYFKRALLLAQTNGALLNTTYEDLYVTNMNIGFEVPGTFDISITIENFSLLAMLD